MRPDKSVDIHVETIKGPGGNRTKIHIRRDDGPKHVYEKLEDVPEDLRPDIEGLLEIPVQSLHPPSGIRTPVDEPSPRRIKRRRGEKRLELIYRWFDVLAALGGIYFGGMFGWWSWSLLHSHSLKTWWFLLPIFGAGCLAGLYCALAFLINRSVIRVSHRRLSVTHGPLPWPGKRRLRPAQIEQLYVRIVPARRSRIYRLIALCEYGEVILLPHVTSAQQALFLEREIEEYLSIDDWPVAGEQVR